VGDGGGALAKRHPKVRKGIILTDGQIPHMMDLSAVEEFMADFQPDTLVYLGDMLDMEPLMGWWERAPGTTNWDAVHAEIDTANAMLDRHDKICKNLESRHWWMGNHEERLTKMKRAHHVWSKQNKRTLPDIARDLRLKDRGFKVHGQNDMVSFGKLYMFHGLDYNEFHTKKTLLNNEVNVVYGHVHSPQRYTKMSRVAHSPKSAWSLGCLCSRNPEWKNGAPNCWVQGFGVFYIHPDGNFNLYVVDIVRGSFVAPNGKFYTTKKK